MIKKRSLGKIILLMTVIFLGIIWTTTSVQASKTTSSDNYLQKIKQKGTLVLGTEPDYPPYEFTKNVNGKEKVMGADITLGEKIAKKMGVKLKIKAMSFDSLLVGLQTGKIDMAISGISKTPERAKSVDFTIPYYSDGQDLVVNSNDNKIKSYKDLANQSVGAQTGSIQYDLVKQQISHPSIKGMESVSDLVLALKTNKIKAIAVESATAKAYVANTSGIKAIDAHFNTKNSQNVVAFHKGAKSLVNVANQVIKKANQHNAFEKQFLPLATKQMGTIKDKKLSVWQQMYQYRAYFIKGLKYTLIISVIGIIMGIILGICFGLMRLSHNWFLHSIAVVYIEFIRGTPALVQIMFFYFGLGTFVNVSAVTAGTIAIGINSGAYVAEIIRSGINSIPKGQNEAALSLGLSNSQTMQSVILPQAFKNIWPALGNEFITLIKDSSLASTIGVGELMYQMKIVQSNTYQGVAPIVVIMVIYFVITFILSRIMKYYEKRLSKTN